MPVEPAMLPYADLSLAIGTPSLAAHNTELRVGEFVRTRADSLGTTTIEVLRPQSCQVR